MRPWRRRLPVGSECDVEYLLVGGHFALIFADGDRLPAALVLDCEADVLLVGLGELLVGNEAAGHLPAYGQLRRRRGQNQVEVFWHAVTYLDETDIAWRLK